MSTWTKLPPIEGVQRHCLNCPPVQSGFAMDSRIAVGFGDAHLERDGEYLWCEESDTEWDDCMTGEQAEAMAAEDPDHDWRIVVNGPLHGETFQRHGPGDWPLVARNEGFA